MAKYTKKWDKDFQKRYTKAIKELDSLEKEYKEMKESNPDKWISMWISESDIEFGENDGFYVSYYGEGQDSETPQEHIHVTLKSELGMFGFNISDFDRAKQFRNDFVEAFDQMQRPVPKPKLEIDEEETEEDLEALEYEEYIIVASRSCTHSWSHTVQARSSSEALRLIEEDSDGSTHDNNDDYDSYGEIDYEIQ